MTYQATVTQKGQITIPKQIRDVLELKQSQRVLIEYDDKQHVAKIMPAYDFLELAKQAKIRKKVDPLKAREQLEKKYERV